MSNRIGLVFLLILASLPTHVFGDDSTDLPTLSGWNIDVVGAVETGAPQALRIQGDTAYVAYYGIFVVLDITDPTQPIRRGSVFLGGWCSGIVTLGSIVYCVVNGATLYVIDASVPGAPFIVRTIPTSGHTIDIDGLHLYLEQGNGVRVYDLSTPSNPQLVGFAATSITVKDFVARNGYVYVAGNSRLQVIDATSSISPLPLLPTLAIGDPRDIDISGGHVFVPCDSGLLPYAFYVIDISNPAAPVIVAADPSLVVNGQMQRICIEGHQLYYARGNAVRSLDISDPLNPVQTMNFVPGEYLADWPIGVNEGILGIGSYYSNLRFIDVSNHAAPTSLSNFRSLDLLNSVAVSGDHLVMSGNSGDLMVMDRNNPSSRARAPAGGIGGYFDYSEILVRGDYVYVTVADTWYPQVGGLHTFDISNPLGPSETDFLLSGIAWGVFSVGSYLYFCPSGQIWITDPSDPAQPQLVDEIVTYGGKAVTDGAYVYYSAYGGDTLIVMDASIPASPHIVSRQPGVESWVDAVVIGSRMFANTFNTIDIFDISNPLDVELVGSIPAIDCYNIEVNGHYAYLSDNKTLRIYDVSSPASPVEVGNLTAPWILGEIAVAAPWLYLIPRGSYNGGPLLILETPLITGADHKPYTNFILKQNYPNPFNPSTTISFVLPREAHSQLRIYDVRGQLVATLVDRVLGPGEHAVQWDARNVSSGMYFYKLEMPGFKETRKMVLLK